MFQAVEAFQFIELKIFLMIEAAKDFSIFDYLRSFSEALEISGKFA